ncbi:MAG: RNA polymerase sigma-32 factor [Myxococcota bacterium]|jgi:RNA polymerase sigma-32 factor
MYTQAQQLEPIANTRSRRVRKPMSSRSDLPVPKHSMDQYMLEVGRIPLLSRDEERALAEQLKRGDDVEAARSLVASNLRFVIKVAFEYQNYGIRMTDLIQEGNVGLMHAVSKFDPDRGYRLISYAVWWIKAYIQNYIIKNWSMVPISARRKSLFGKRKALAAHDGESGSGRASDGNDSHFLVAAETEKEQKALKAARREADLARRDFSLDNTVGDDGGVTHLQRLPSTAPSAEETMGTAEVRQQVQVAIGTVLEDLDDRGRYILQNRLIAEEPMSLAQIGLHFGVSRERARQLELRVKKKLKSALSHLGEAEISG